MEFRAIHTIQTEEHIPLKVELAGVANRVFAFLVDFLLMLVVMGIALIIYLVLVGNSEELAKTWLPLAMFVIFFGFHLVQEWLWNGKTLGKHLFKIRVVRTNGQAIGFWEAFGRNLFRVLDVYVSGIGLICMMFSREERRFGDYVAGTLVISDQVIERPVVKPTLSPEEDQPPERSDSHAITAGLTPEEYELIRNFMGRRERLFPQSRAEMAGALAGYFKERLHYLPETDKEQQNEALLEALYDDYRQHVLAGR